MADYVTAPTAKVKEKFTVTGSQSGKPVNAGPSPTVSKGKVPPPAALPPPLSMQAIDQMYAPLRKEIEALPPPTPAPVPQKTPALNAFISALGANLGAALTRNPAMGQQVTDYMIQKEQERKAAEAQNYATRLAFDQNKRNQLIQIRAQSLETALKGAMEANDSERAAKIAENLHKLQAEVQANVLIPAETEKGIKIAQEEGRQQRLNIAATVKAALEKETEGIGKPLTAQQLQKAIDDVNKNKELTTQENGFFGNIWQSLFGGDKKVGKKDMLKGAYVTGLIAGEPQVRSTSKRRLLTMVYSELGLLKKYKPDEPFKPADEAAVRKALADLGLDPERDVFQVP